MSGYDFESELSAIRADPKPKPKPSQPKAPVVNPSKTGGTAPKPKAKAPDAPPIPPTEVFSDAELEGLMVTQSSQESGKPSSASTPSKKRKVLDVVGWKQFKTLPGLFLHVGGDYPVELSKDFRKSQVSGIPDPLITYMQEALMARHMGATIEFPWGTYTVTEKNRVFTTKSSLVRYMLFDGMRDAAGSHIQYAKQWLALQHPAFTREFKPEVHLKPNSDELDIYALLAVADSATPTESSVGLSPEVVDDIRMVNMGMGRVLDKLQAQEDAFAVYAERTHMIQTVLLLDRMGLLKGGIPRDIGGFVRILEQSREELSSTGDIVDKHVLAEKERAKVLRRETRMRKERGS